MAEHPRRPTIEDVARRASVSNVTVSRVVNAEPWVSVKTRARVEEAMRELGYRPNRAARSMRSGRANSIGFIMADLTNGFNALVAETAQKVFFDNGYMMFVGSSEFDNAKERRLLQFLEEHQVDGFLLSLNDDEDPEVTERLKQLRAPCIALDRDLPDSFDAVLFDHAASISQAVQHLVSLGHKRIALFAAAPRYRVGRVRHAAFVQAMRDANLPVDPALIRNEHQTADYAFLEALSMLSGVDRPTAILAAGNQILFGVLRAIRANGLRFPHDISVIGADEPDITELFDPPITILDRDVRMFAKAAASMLLDRMNGTATASGRKVMLGTKLSIRESCAAPPF